MEHTPELRELLQKKPFWPIRWGNTVILCSLLGIFILANTVLLPLPFSLNAKIVEVEQKGNGKVTSIIYETADKTTTLLKPGDSIKIFRSAPPHGPNRAVFGIIKSAGTVKNGDKGSIIIKIETVDQKCIKFQAGDVHYLSLYEEKTFMGWIRNE